MPKGSRLLVLLAACLAAVAIATASGCSSNGTTTGDGGTADTAKGGAEGDACSSPTDCNTGLFCDTTTNKCTKPECETDADCSGKKCIEMKCEAVGDECTGPADCPVGQDCVQLGKKKYCKEAQADAKVDKVEIIAGPTALRSGGKGKYVAVAYNVSGARIVKALEFKWKSTAADVVAIDEKSGEGTGGAKSGNADITAEVGGKTSAPYKVANYGTVGSTDVRVVVLSAASGAPVAGATVVAGGKTEKTDASGAATFAGLNPPVDFHVFHADYQFFSGYGVNKRDLMVILGKNADVTKAGGFKGKFVYQNIHGFKDWADRSVAFGLAGLSIRGDLLNIDFDTLVGPMFKYELLPGTKVSLPSGVSVNLAGAGKLGYEAMGTQGKRILWSIGGKVKMEDIQPIMDALKDTSNINVGALIAKVIPLFGQFAFGQVTDLTVQAIAKVADVDDKNEDGSKTDLIPDFAKFPTKDITLDTPLDQKVTVSATGLPAYSWKGKPVDFFIFSLAGSMVEGAGIVPLGVGVAEVKGTSANMDVVYAGAKGVVRSGKFVVLAMVLNIATGDDKAPTLVSGAVKFSDKAPTSVSFDKFLGFPAAPPTGKVTYDPKTRTVKVEQITGAGFYQVHLTDEKGRDWLIMTKGAPDFVLPAVPTGIDDRMVDPDTAYFRPIVLSGGKSLDDLLEFNGTNMDRLTENLSVFSNTPLKDLVKK